MMHQVCRSDAPGRHTWSSGTELARSQFYFQVYIKYTKSGPKKNASYCRTWPGLMILKTALEH